MSPTRSFTPTTCPPSTHNCKYASPPSRLPNRGRGHWLLHQAGPSTTAAALGLHTTQRQKHNNNRKQPCVSTEQNLARCAPLLDNAWQSCRQAGNQVAIAAGRATSKLPTKHSAFPCKDTIVPLLLSHKVTSTVWASLFSLSASAPQNASAPPKQEGV